MQHFERYHFKEQEKDEDIQEVIRRHWFDILWQFIPLIFATLLIVSLFIVARQLLSETLDERILYFFLSFLLLIFWLSASVIWIDYYLDVWIITNKRVVNVEQKGLFMREVSELHYNKIQDITTEVHGFIPTILHYGDVYVQTAGTQPRFLFHNVPDPYKIKDRLAQLQKSMRKKDLTEVQKIIHNKEEFQM